MSEIGRIRIDFWQGSGGPNAFPAQFIQWDYDDNGTYEGTKNAYTGITTPHDPQGMEYVFDSTDFGVPADLFNAAHWFQLRLQFPAGSVSASAFANLSFKTPAMGDYLVVRPSAGYTALSGDAFDIQGLWPRDYYFHFSEPGPVLAPRRRPLMLG